MPGVFAGERVPVAALGRRRVELDQLESSVVCRNATSVRTPSMARMPRSSPDDTRRKAKPRLHLVWGAKTLTVILEWLICRRNRIFGTYRRYCVRLIADRQSVRVWLVEAFTKQAFAGNPAGVCLLEQHDWPEENWMRLVAAELNAETAFVYRHDDASGSWALRWFAGDAESNICGHATLAAAHVLRDEQLDRGSIRFWSPFGPLTAHPQADGAITLDFPAARLTEGPVVAGLAAALREEPIATFSTGRLGDLLVVARDETAVRALRPDFAAIASVCRHGSLRGIIVTARTDSIGSGYDFVSRYFASANGLDEDAVTGSAHTALGPYWSRVLGRASLTGLQASARTGVVRTTVRGGRIDLTGYAVTTMAGVIT
jgi:PhzF family phenazine biosynthesis protein